MGNLRDWEVACSASDRQGLNFESCVWRAVSSHSSHHWLRTKSWDISFDFHIGKYRGVIRSKLFFSESVTFQFHARMLSSEVAQSLKSYGHFSDLGVGEVLSAQFSLYVHKCDLKPHSFHFIYHRPRKVEYWSIFTGMFVTYRCCALGDKWSHSGRGLSDNTEWTGPGDPLTPGQCGTPDKSLSFVSGPWLTALNDSVWCDRPAWPLLTRIAPVAETGFSHRLTAYKIVGHFFRLSYRKISRSYHVKNSFFRISNISVPCPHAQLRGRTVIKKLWTFLGPWGRDRSVTTMLDFSRKANPSIHGLGEDDTAITSRHARLTQWWPDAGPSSTTLASNGLWS